MLDDITYEPDKPIRKLPPRALVKLGAAWLLFFAFSLVAAYFVASLWWETVVPYQAQGPVIVVSFGALSMVGVLPGILCFLGMVTITWIGYLRGWRRRAIESTNRRILPLAVGCLGIAVVMWIAGGPAIASHLSSLGYQHCSELSSDIGINYYRRAYVAHPYLCVEDERLPDRLAVYHRLEQARKEGRLREAMIEEGFSVDRQGRLVYPKESAE